jgi:AcrR family transcriptional regulator
MGERADKTRKRILDAAWRLIEESRDPTAGLAEIAKTAGVSRQALYLHFGSRAGLLVALVQHTDEELGLEERLATIAAQPTAEERLRQFMRVAATYAPKIHDVAMALSEASRTDEDARVAFDDRMKKRRAGLRELVKGVADADKLAEGWTVNAATDALWALSTPQTYQDLVVARGWSIARYEALLVRLVDDLVLAKGLN